MNAVTTICLGAVALAAVLCIARMIMGPSLADRVVALDTFVLTTVSAIVVAAARSGSGRFVAVALVAALLGFCSTVTVARFIERRGAR
jgi:multisubunit Na+/H+ antiporter MnhF subunit